MYKSDKYYYSIDISKEDILELENMLEERFAKGNTRKSFYVNTPNRNLEPVSMYEFLNEQVHKKVNSISIKYTESTQDFSSVKYLRVYISKSQISVSIEGIDEVWVSGMAQLFKVFFKERKSRIIQLANLIPYVASALVGISLVTIVNSIKEEQILSTVLSGCLLSIGIIFAYTPIRKMFFPAVKLILTPKVKKDWMFFWTVLGALGTILGFITAIIALWK